MDVGIRARQGDKRMSMCLSVSFRPYRRTRHTLSCNNMHIGINDCGMDIYNLTYQELIYYLFQHMQ